MRSPLTIWLAFLRLGCISFGGPAAHIGYFRSEFVERRKWITDEKFAEVVALAQSLPGPGSSQTGFAIGLMNGGILGGLAAWFGFTLPSALLMFAFAMLQGKTAGPWARPVVHALQLVAVAVVAQAVLKMKQTLAPDRSRATIACAGAAVVLLLPFRYATLLAIALGGCCGFLLKTAAQPQLESEVPRRRSWICAAGFAALFSLRWYPGRMAALFASFYTSGALVFGGGHVVLPLLQATVVGPGLVTEQQFLSGYAMAQAIPGPLFTLSAYLGAAAAGPLGAAVSLIAIFAPGLLLMTAVLPFAAILNRHRNVLSGINAAVVGVLGAALYTPIWTSTIHDQRDVAAALGLFTLLAGWAISPWKIVLLAIGVAALSVAA